MRKRVRGGDVGDSYFTPKSTQLNMKSLFSTFIACILIISNIQAQTFTRLGDINPGTANAHMNADIASIAYHDKMLFTANDGTHGNELWQYDGTTVSLLKDIYSGAASSNCKNYFLVNDKVVFTAQDSAHGVELWITDGTAAGTQLLKDVFPGTAGGVFTSFSDAPNFYIFNNELYFTGANRSDDFELWKTNGTESGTKLVKNIAADGMTIFSSSFPTDYAEYQGALYFSCRKGLWKTNGTTAGTVLVEDKDPEDVFGLEPIDLVSNGDYLLFIQNTNLWSSDGTSAGTKKIQNLGNVYLNWSGNRFTRLGNKVLFPGSDATHGEELWISDGTSAGTSLVTDLDPGTDGYTPQNNLLYKGKVYYKGDNGNSGIELFSSDGTAAGTQLVKNIGSGSNSGFYLPTEIYTDGDYLYMSAGPAFNTELWVSDGTTNGTYGIDINPDDESHPIQLNAFDGKLFFFASTEEEGYEPYILDLTTGIEEQLPLASVQVYPNPVQDFIQIENVENLILQVSLYDAKGNLVRKGDQWNKIDVRDQSAGIYFIRLEDEKGRVMLKKTVVVGH